MMNSKSPGCSVNNRPTTRNNVTPEDLNFFFTGFPRKEKGADGYLAIPEHTIWF